MAGTSAATHYSLFPLWHYFSIKFIKHIKGKYVRHLLPIGGEPAAREGAHSNSGA